MKTRTKPALRLMALNLALMLLCSLILPAPALAADNMPSPTAAEQPLAEKLVPLEDDYAPYDPEQLPLYIPHEKSADDTAQLMTGQLPSYQICVDGQCFPANEAHSGTGWNYVPEDLELQLTTGYSGKWISASGDLFLYVDGDVSVRGPNLRYYGGDAIEISGALDLTVVDGTLHVTGGNATTSDGRGGSAIDAYAGLDIWLYAGILLADGGSTYAAGGIGGSALHSYSGFVTLNDRPDYYQNPDGTSSYTGRWPLGSRIQIEGGYGTDLGGPGITAGGIILDADGAVNGGSSSYPWSAAPALYCETYMQGYADDSTSESTSVSLTLTAGNNSSSALLNQDGQLPNEMISPHLERQENLYGITPYSLELYPKQYLTRFNGVGGAPVSGNSGDPLLLPYPYAIDPLDHLFEKPGYYLYGFRSSLPDRLVTMNDWFFPYADTTLEARWAPYSDSTVLFLGNHGTIGGNEFSTARTGPAVAPPSASSSYPQSLLLGWCSDDSWNWDEATCFMNDDAVWLEPGLSSPQTKAAIYHARWQYPGISMVRYHGNGGVRPNGSNLALQCNGYGADDMRITVAAGPIQFQKDDCLFTGWETADGVPYVPGAVVSGGTQVELYAQWAPIQLEPQPQSFTGAPIPIRSLLVGGQASAPGAPGRFTYLLDGQPAQLDTTVLDAGTYQLTACYEDSQQTLEKTVTLEVTKGVPVVSMMHHDTPLHITAPQQVDVATLAADWCGPVSNVAIEEISDTAGLLNGTVTVSGTALSYQLREGLTRASAGKEVWVTITYDSQNCSRSTMDVALRLAYDPDGTTTLLFNAPAVPDACFFGAIYDSSGRMLSVREMHPADGLARLTLANSLWEQMGSAKLFQLQNHSFIPMLEAVLPKNR